MASAAADAEMPKGLSSSSKNYLQSLTYLNPAKYKNSIPLKIVNVIAFIASREIDHLQGLHCTISISPYINVHEICCSPLLVGHHPTFLAMLLTSSCSYSFIAGVSQPGARAVV